ncbi:methoxymalonate biosynthesis protein [Actinosynnema sp. ALI-1.44]|uniref:phosphopantetheine-binding protein n=1 Tax=Actinosynnema sp. ALI-1.44 TaxID=1933779 RepID=UPI00097C8363|nr:phosphopantetheine-binding protein [Actinosynnema sp. ALI-1.44]ONI75276.1 methoxymalonate biosynthesis protein [Actinosynnema sp. ALI-1.44]
MTTANAGAETAAETVEKDLTVFLVQRTGAEPDVDQDLFATGVISSMFAMELVVHLEDTYDIEIVGPELSRDNFRSVRAVAAMVLRLSSAEAT